MHSAPILAPRPISDALHRVQWQRTIAGYIVDAIEPAAMLALIGLALGCLSCSSHKGFLIFASIALALTAARRLNNAIVAWTDLQDLATYGWLASVMWVPAVAAWALAWNRWCPRASRVIDGATLVLALLGVAGGAMRATELTRISRLGLLALFVLIAARMVRGSEMRIMAVAIMALIVVSQFTGELRALGIPDIWFPFGIGVTLVQYIYAIAIPLLALLIVRTLDAKTARS